MHSSMHSSQKGNNNKCDSKRRAWDQDQDEKLISAIAEHGPQQWDILAQTLPNRTGK